MKRLLSFVLICVSLISVFSLSVNASSGVSVYIEDSRFSGGIRVTEDTTYVGIRRFSTSLYPDAKVNYDYKTRTLTIKTDKLTITCKDGDNYIVANGRYFYFDKPIYMYGGVMYAPILNLYKAFGAKIKWDNQIHGFRVSRGTGYVASGSSYYSEDEVYWLSKIISAESRGEPLLGKIAVGNVILNRVESSAYPNTIYGVIFDKKYGIQFSPVANGTIYNAPTAESIVAAKICLDGYSISDDILYFVNPRVAPNSWISKNGILFTTIGNHAFYMSK